MTFACNKGWSDNQPTIDTAAVAAAKTDQSASIIINTTTTTTASSNSYAMLTRMSHAYSEQVVN
jgi:hypothetical protein